MLMLHRMCLPAHWLLSKIMFFQAKYKDRIKGRVISTNELFFKYVNENMQIRDTGWTKLITNPGTVITFFSLPVL